MEEKAIRILQSQRDYLVRTNLILWRFVADFIQNRNKNATVRDPNWSAMLFRADNPTQTYVILWRSAEPSHPSVHTIDELQHGPFPDEVKNLADRLEMLQNQTFAKPEKPKEGTGKDRIKCTCGTAIYSRVCPVHGGAF